MCARWCKKSHASGAAIAVSLQPPCFKPLVCLCACACVCVHACARLSLLLSCCRDRYGGLEQARDPFQTPRELRKGVSAGPKCRISLSFCTPEGRTHTRARPILLGGGWEGGGGERERESCRQADSGFTIFIPHVRARGGRERRIFTCPISLPRLHVAAPARLPACTAVGNPRGAAIKENLRAFLSLPPFLSPLSLFSYEV